MILESEVERLRAEIVAEIAEAMLNEDPNATIGDAEEHPADFVRRFAEAQ